MQPTAPTPLRPFQPPPFNAPGQPQPQAGQTPGTSWAPPSLAIHPMSPGAPTSASPVNGVRSPAPPMLGPPPVKSPYSHPPASNVAPFPYPHAPIPPFTPAGSNAASHQPSPLSQSRAGTPPAQYQTMSSPPPSSQPRQHNRGFPSGPSMPMVGMVRATSSEPAGLPPLPSIPGRPAPLHVSSSTNSLASNASPRSYQVTDEGVNRDLTGGMAPFHHRQPTPTAAMMSYQFPPPAHQQQSSMPQPTQPNFHAPPVQNFDSPQFPHMPNDPYQQPQPAAAFPSSALSQLQQQPPMSSYPMPPAHHQPQQPHYPPVPHSQPQPQYPNEVPGYQSFPPEAALPNVVAFAPPSFPMLPYEQQSYGSYVVYPQQPPRFSYIKPVDPAHVSLACSAFPATIETFNECALPFGVVMTPLTASLSQHPTAAPNDPAAVALMTAPAQSLASPTAATPINSAASPTFNQPMPSPTNINANNTFTFANVQQSLPDGQSPASHIPIIRPGPSGVVRCKECKAYINGYVQWLNQGKGWKCNLCLSENLTPATYYSPVTASDGRRMDWNEREELKNASYEIYAPKDYMVRAAVPPLVCLIVDVSRAAYQSSFLDAVCATVLEMLDTLALHPKSLISLLTFSDIVHFYAIHSKGKGPVMHVLTTIDELFLPVPVGLLIRVSDCKAQLQTLFQSLPNMHRPANNNLNELTDQACFATALEAAQSVMGRYGGRILAFVSSPVTIGRGVTTDRQKSLLDSKDTDSAIKAMQPQSLDYYKRLCDALQKHQMTVDIYALPPSVQMGQGQSHPLNSPHYGRAPMTKYVDVATLSEIAKLTGGDLFYLPDYDTNVGKGLTAQRQYFVSLIKQSLMQSQCFESVFRVRVSKGLLVNDFHGHFTIRGSSLLAIPCSDTRKTLSFELIVDPNDKQALTQYKERHAVIQTGLLYTSYVGERRIIVHTLVVPLYNQIARLYDSVNIATSISVITKRCVWLAYAHSAKQAREYIKQKASNIHRMIKKSQSSLPTTLSVMQSFDYYTLCLYKCQAFRDVDGIGTTASNPLDQCASVLTWLYTANITNTLQFFSPVLLPLHALVDDPSLGMLVGSDSGTNQTVMPQSLPLTFNSIQPVSQSQSQPTNTLWLLYTGMDVLVRIGQAFDPSLLQQIFGTHIQSLRDIDANSWPVELLGQSQSPDAGLRSRINNVIHTLIQSQLSLVSSVPAIQAQSLPPPHPIPVSVKCIREFDASDALFHSFLAEDRRGKEAGMHDWTQWLESS